MASKLPVAPVLHYTLTIAGTAAATIGTLQDYTPLAICGIAAVVTAVILAVLSRRAMRERCWLIIEATMVHSEMKTFTIPAMDTGTPRSRCIIGQAVPSTESGRPSEMNAI